MKLPVAGAPWLQCLPAYWPVKPIAAMFIERNEKNDGKGAKQLLSLSYGRIIRRDAEGNDGLRPESYDTYQQLQPTNIVLRLIDLQNDKRSIRVGQVMEPGIITSAYVAVDTEAWADPRYAFYLLLTLDQLKVFYGLGSGMRQSILFGDLGKVPVAVPNAEEQIAIAAYLDAETKRIDELISAKKDLKKKLSGLSQSIFIDELIAISNKLPGAVTGRLPWMPTVPSSWTRCKVKHLVEHFDQGVSPQCESRKPDEDEWGVLKAGCINSGEFDPTESKALPPEISPIPEVTVCAGDLIISRANTRDLVGRSAVAQHDYPKLMLSDKLYRLKLDKARCIPEFVRRALWVSAVRSRIEERATGASPSMQNIDRRTILELDIVLPSLVEQKQMLDETDSKTNAIQKLIEHVDTEIALLAEMRSATITDAVLGRIDVRKSQTH